MKDTDDHEDSGDLDITDPWRRKTRLLWRRHSHPDNHTDDSFLSALVINAKVKRRNYWQVGHGWCYLSWSMIEGVHADMDVAPQVVFGSKLVAQQMGTVACVIALSLHLHQVRRREWAVCYDDQVPI